MTRSVILLAGLAMVASAGAEQTGVPTYTNEDLERLARFRGQTGALSSPQPAAPVEAAPRLLRREEEFWRRQARQLEERLTGLRRRADDLRAQIRAAREASPRRGSRVRRDPDSNLAALERRLQATEREMRERRDDLEERARRAGALPGWLR